MSPNQERSYRITQIRKDVPAIRDLCCLGRTPSVAPSIDTPPRSRLTTSTSWCAANHWRTLSASRSASRSTILCVSRFTRMLPKRLPRRQLQSSTPTARTWPISGRGTRKREQSTVASEMGIASLLPRRSPPLPPVANPMSCTAVRSRFVRRDEVSMKSASRSVKTLREQVGLRQKNFRTVNTNRMGRPAQGKSLGCLRYELWMADEGIEQCGQGEVARYEVTCTRTSSGVSLTEVISRPSGKGNKGDEGINLLEKRFLCWLEQIFGVIPQNITSASPKSWKSQNYAGVDMCSPLR